MSKVPILKLYLEGITKIKLLLQCSSYQLWNVHIIYVEKYDYEGREINRGCYKMLRIIIELFN